MLYVGIDQHRKQLTVSVRDESGNVILRRQVSTTWEKVGAFFSDIRQRADEHGGYLAVVEVCGFNDWLLMLLRAHGCRDTIVVQPGEQSSHKPKNGPPRIVAVLGRSGDFRNGHRLVVVPSWITAQAPAGWVKDCGLRAVGIATHREK